MKIIDLLNKIANDEEVPYKIKYNEKIYEYVEEIKWYLRDDMKCELSNSKKCLNDEIEIIEDTSKEDNKIEKLDYHTDHNDDIVLESYQYRTYPSFGIDPLSDSEEVLMMKINEIIEVINEKL